MLFASPIVKEQVTLDPRFAGLKEVTNEDLATIAMERRGLRDLEVMRHVNSMLKEANKEKGSNFIALRLYNGGGERLWLDSEKYSDNAGVWKYPPDLFIDPGQWSVIVAEGVKVPKTGNVSAGLTIGYFGDESNISVCWCAVGEDALVILNDDSKKQDQKRPPQANSAALHGIVATIRRGFSGDNVVVDGNYTTLRHFPYPHKQF